MNPTIKIIQDAFENRGNEKYGTEPVTQLEHAYQCADLAISNSASDHLVVASLLHDIGHILGGRPLPTEQSQNYDDRHEQVGYDFLVENFGDNVAEPVRMHVAAKRYLCTTEPTYQQKLSATSVKSFYDQGGLMSEQEVAEFESSSFLKEALMLRRWDDQAKSTTSSRSNFHSFVDYISRCLVTS